MPEPLAKANDRSDLDVVRLMEAYGLADTSPQTSLKKRVQIDDISVLDFRFEPIVSFNQREFTMPVVLHGALTEYDVPDEWHSVEELEPISSYISDHCI